MAFRFIGVSSTAITDGGSQAPTINGQTWSTSNLLNGDTCMYNYGRFMWNTSTSKWVGQGDVNIHSDVQSALNDIIVANKGEEVRGSIYDALALMDARSIMIEDDIIDNMDPIIAREVENISGAYLGQVAMTIELDSQTHTGTCSLYPTAILGHVNNGKVLLTKLIYDGKARHCLTTSIRNESSLYVTTMSLLETSTIEMITVLMPRPNEGTISQYNRVLVPISGGGGSYTEGDGIDINNNEISVKLRSSNPGLAFDGNGNLYATGGGGSYTSGAGIDIDANNEISLKTKTNGGISTDSNGAYIDTSIIQKKLTSTNAGTGISITVDAQGNPVISLDLPQAEGGGF